MQDVARFEGVVSRVEDVCKLVVLAHVWQKDGSAVALASCADQVVFYVARLVLGLLDSHEFQH